MERERNTETEAIIRDAGCAVKAADSKAALTRIKKVIGARKG